MTREQAEKVIALMTLSWLAEHHCPAIERHQDICSLNAEYGMPWAEYMIDYGGNGEGWAREQVIEWLMEEVSKEDVLRWLRRSCEEIERQIREQELQKTLHQHIDLINTLVGARSLI